MRVTPLDTKPRLSHYPGKAFKWACASTYRYAVGKTRLEAYNAWKGSNPAPKGVK